jgi:hypothetical protein
MLNRMLIISAVLTLSLCMQGCIVAAVGAGVGAWKYGNAKKAEAHAKDMQAYNDYVIGMEKVNTDRQCKHLKPEPTMSYEQYLK